MSAPQRSLYGGLLLTSLVVTAALLWSGWRLVTLQRELDARQARQEAEAAADALAADIRDALAELGDHLSARLDDPSAAGRAPTDTVVARAGADWRAETTGGLPFLPWHAGGASVDEAFAHAEAAEFMSSSLDDAIQRYRALARHADPSLRAGALVRLARVLRKQYM